MNAPTSTPATAATTDIEAAVFRQLVAHLQAHPEVQNIDLMNLANFCRNCLAKWYVAAAAERGVAMTELDAKALVYGMPYDEWKARHQAPATEAQKAQFQAVTGHSADSGTH